MNGLLPSHDRQGVVSFSYWVMVSARSLRLGLVALLPAIAAVLLGQEAPTGGNASVFIILKDQPQKAIFERSQGASQLRREIVEGRYREVARQVLPNAESLRQARESVDQVEIETRQAAFLEIEQFIGAEQAAIEAVVAGMGGSGIHRYKGVNMLSASVPPDALSLLAADPRIAEIAPVERHHILLSTSVPELGAPTFWTNGYTGQGQAVAVLDSGVRTNHPAFAGKTITSQVFLTNGSRDSCFGDDASSAEDQHGHGTHLAGIVMSQGMTGWLGNQGVARGIDALYNVKIAFREKSGTGCEGPASASALSSDAFAGLDWLVSSTPAKIANYSLGGSVTADDSTSARTWDRYVDSYGLTVSVSAGNSGPGPATMESPGIGYNIISAANWVTRGTMRDSSSRGPTAGGRYKPDIATPGTSIVSTNYNWDAGSAFVAKTGTSMAAPHVAGSAALLQSAGVPSGLATKAVLLNTTDNAGWAADRGWGYANLNRAWGQRAYVVDALTANGTPGGYRLYRATIAGDFRGTVAWNRHIDGGTQWTLNNIDLFLYNGASQNSLSSSTTTIQNVEQVAASGYSGDAVVKVKMATAAPLGGVASEPYGLAFSTSNWAAAAGPSLSGNCDVPSLAPPGQPFQAICTAANRGDLSAFDVQGQLSLPVGFSGPSQVAFGTIPAGVSSQPVILSLTSGTAGSYTLLVNLASTSFEETFTGGIAFSVRVSTTALAVAPASPLPNGTVGGAYSQTLAATGGTPPYTWTLSAGALPAGLTLSAAGVLSGTPTQACAGCNFTVQVADSRGTVATKPLALTIVAPPAPALSFTGLSGSVNPAAQPSFNVTLAAPYPIPILGSLTLEFTPDAVSPADDPAIQFSTGGRTLNFTIPAGQTSAFTTPPAFQTGTVAGAIKLTLRLTAAGHDITPTPIPSVTVQVARSAPVIGTVQVVRTSGGFEVRITGYSTPRQMTQAVFDFTAAVQAGLQTTSLTVSLGTAFTAWYAGTPSAQFGSQFLYTQPFTVQGEIGAIAAGSVILSNAVGSSQAASFAF